jgi:hypothetical protein
VFIMKLLRSSATRELLKLVYISMCESILSYCIGVWGGSTSSALLPLERAQRFVLKVMLGKPRLFPTVTLYKVADVLSVRQLMILRVTIRVHQKTILSEEYPALLRKRIFKIPSLRTKTAFARRFPNFLHPFIYNAVEKACNISKNSTREAKTKIQNWLKSLSYSQTEILLKVLT